MTILIGIPCLKTGGTEIQTLHLVEALVNGGYHCITVCYFEYDYTMVQLFKQAGSRVVCLSAYGNRPEGNLNVYKFLKRGLKRVVDEYRPKIAHIQYMAPGAMPIMILRKLGIKTILATLHTDASIYKSLRLIHYLQKHTVRAFTCVTEAAERSFFGTSNLYNKNTTLARHNHLTIHNCLSPNIVCTDNPTATPTIPTIGMVARLETIKGVDLVMPAFAKVLTQNPDMKLIIVGDGKEKDKMVIQQKEHQIPDERVVWIGQVPHNKLSELYGKMTLVWVPSRSEGFGLSAIEAMAQGRVVVASDTGGLTEIINDGTNGLLFHNGDANHLAARTLEVLTNSELHEQVRINALSRAQHYTFDRYSNDILDLYSKII